MIKFIISYLTCYFLWVNFKESITGYVRKISYLTMIESHLVIDRNNPIQNTLIVKVDMQNFKRKRSRVESRILVSINNKRDFFDIR